MPAKKTKETDELEEKKSSPKKSSTKASEKKTTKKAVIKLCPKLYNIITQSGMDETSGFPNEKLPLNILKKRFGIKARRSGAAPNKKGR